MRTCVEEGSDQDGRGGGLAMTHGHLHGPRAAHHHVRQQRDMARRDQALALQAVVAGGVRPAGRERPATPVAAGLGAADEGPATSSKQEGASAGFAKGYRRKDGCPVPGWFVDKHGKGKDTWKTQKEMQKSGAGGAKRRRC